MRAALAAAFLAGSSLLAQPVFALETVRLTMSSSHPTAVAWVGALKTHVVDNANTRLEEMGSDYRIEWTEAFGGSLYDFNDTLEAVEEGLTDMGWVGSLWEPAKMPLQNIMFATPFVTSDVVLSIEVMNALNDTIPEMKDEWDRHNLVFLGATVSDTYHLFTKFPVNSLDDLKGKKIVGAPALGPWLEGTGAIPVGGGLPTFYQQIQTGVADGSIIIPTGAFSLKLYEVAPYITLVDMGVTTIGGLAVNKDRWEGLPEDVRKVLSELGREYSRVHAEDVAARYDSSLQKMKEAGATITELPQEERRKWVAGLTNLARTWVDQVEKSGLPGKEILTKFMDEARARGAEPLREWDKEL
ncbi:C4-dicarboxylate TRAP transporter substrate-binding protein [Faunimonas sp. B44]|uniref:C4-dicarboxylate TRAP transporter substrate-binding protein n=1 Tax=Faunimonas sp. B44 TaxID=3461493 RepID=UPI004043F5F1